MIIIINNDKMKNIVYFGGREVVVSYIGVYQCMYDLHKLNPQYASTFYSYNTG